MERLSMWLVSRGMEHTVETISSNVWSSRSTGQLSEVRHRWGLTVPASRADSPNKLVEQKILCTNVHHLIAGQEGGG